MYALLTLMIVTTNTHGIEDTTIEWNPEPLSVHETWRLCKLAYYDAAGFKRRLTETIWPEYSPILKCEKIKYE
jgi:hypothetical protein